MKISEAYDEYRDERLLPKGRSSSTLKQFNHHRGSIIEYLGDIEVESLDIKVITDYQRWLMDSRCGNTVRCYTISLRQVLGNCLLHGRKVTNPNLIPLPKCRPAESEYVTAGDVRVMLDRAKDLRDRLVISMLYSSGVRVSELTNVKIKDICGNRFTVRGKGDKLRICFLDERTQKLIRAYLVSRQDSCEYLIAASDGQHKLTTTSVERIVRQAREAAGIDRRLTPHSFRHGFATDLLENGAAIQDVSEMLGHSTVQTTMIYRHVSDRGLWKKYEKSHSI